jgi:hypothetical protein
MSTARMFTSTNVNMNSNTLTNQFQGGGDKKAGFPYQIGRDWWTSITLNACDPTSAGGCCTLNQWSITKKPAANISRPIGSTVNPQTYWRVA